MKSFDVSLLICSSFLITYCLASANVHTSDSFIVDQAGRVRIYHGVNFVMKAFPWYSPELLDRDYVASLAQWGINFIRLGYVLDGSRFLRDGLLVFF